LISAIFLAAGEAKRFGSCKQLTIVDGKPLLQHTLDTLRASRVDDVVVVLGAYANEILDAIEFRDERIVVNPGYASGMSTSIQAGLRAIDADAAFIVLADQPFVTAATYDLLMDEYRRTHARVLVPTFHGKRGNPVLIDRTLFSRATQLRGDAGFRAIFAEDEVREVVVGDRGVVVDIDRRDDVPTQC